MNKKSVRKAIALVFREGDKIRAFKRSMTKSVYAGLWSLPSTYLKEHEDAATAANRLVQRKLGLQGVAINEMPIGNSGHKEKPEWILDMTAYEVLSWEGDISFAETEYMEERLVTLEELAKLVAQQDVEDAGECTKTFLRSEGL